MINRAQSLRILPVVSILLLGLGCVKHPQKPSDAQEIPLCTPGFVEVSDGPFVARSGPLELHAVGLLVGCKERLGSLTDANREKIVSEILIDALLRESQPRSPLVRGRIVRAVNELLGEQVVSDVFIYRTSFVEYGPE
jgi:hypothetical protein